MTMFKPLPMHRAVVVFVIALSGVGAGQLAARPPGDAAVTNLPALPAGLTLPLTNAPAVSPTNTPAVPPPVPAADAAADDPDAQNVYEDIALLTEAMLMVRRHYVDELDYHDIVYSALHGMLSTLDPHSAFLEPRQTGDLKEDTEARFVGIGIEMGMRNGLPLVIAPIEDSPAQNAGILSGDTILAIEGQPAHMLNLDQVVKRLRGIPGTSVSVTVGREGRDPFDVTLVRDQIRVSSVKGVRVLPGGRIGYLRVTQFSEPTGGEVARALATLTTNDLIGIVLDLRDNPGGLLDQAIAVAAQFLRDKTVIVTTRGREGSVPAETFRAEGRRKRVDLPLAILINRGTASAAEIVTGALQDAGRAIVIGETSFGKASVQKILPLSTRENCTVKLTTAHYFTPKGRLIHGTGIVPDIVVSLPPSAWRLVQTRRAYEERPEAYPPAERQELPGAVDTQLQRAVDVLTGVHVFGTARKP
jgi:carboxyl-terminal processing protease